MPVPSNLYGYTGRNHDSETELQYYRARYFDNNLGRFINRDPIGYYEGMNLYRGYFVSNGVDPSGLAAPLIIGGVVVTGAAVVDGLFGTALTIALFDYVINRRYAPTPQTQPKPRNPSGSTADPLPVPKNKPTEDQWKQQEDDRKKRDQEPEKKPIPPLPPIDPNDPKHCSKVHPNIPTCGSLEGNGFYFIRDVDAINSVKANAKPKPCQSIRKKYKTFDDEEGSCPSSKMKKHIDIYCTDQPCPPGGCDIGGVMGCDCCDLKTGAYSSRWKKNQH